MSLVKKSWGLLLMLMICLACLFPQNVHAEEIPGNPQAPAPTEVVQPTPSIRINKKKKSLERGDRVKLRARIKDSSMKKVIWRSSKKRVATVDRKGVVTARDKRPDGNYGKNCRNRY